MVQTKGKFEMKITTKGIAAVVGILIPLLSLATYCGVLKSQININEKQIIILKADLKVTEAELQSELENKVDIKVWEECMKRVDANFDRLDDNLTGINVKLDKLIERK